VVANARTIKPSEDPDVLTIPEAVPVSRLLRPVV
jgi:hypothetical protein